MIAAIDLDEESKVLDWVFTEKLASGALQMMQDSEDITESHSYFPYQSDLKLVQKTYYSAATFQTYFFIIKKIFYTSKYWNRLVKS